MRTGGVVPKDAAYCCQGHWRPAAGNAAESRRRIEREARVGDFVEAIMMMIARREGPWGRIRADLRHVRQARKGVQQKMR
jgi:hypothetical protein